MTVSGKGPSGVKNDLIKTVLTWGHVITISVLAIAAITNIGGLIAIIISKEHAEAITRYAEAWQTFFITGIVGYDAKSAIENVLKISKSVKELQVEKSSTDDPGNG